MELLKKLKDVEFWKTFKDKAENAPFIKVLEKEYEDTCIGEIETTKFSKFRLFKDTGDRSSYQETFFKRQHRLYTISLLSLIYPENEEYLKLLQDTIWDICDLYVWAMPAHIGNSWDVDKANSGILDLDATTMAFALAIIKTVFGDRLHPLIKSRIDCEIDRRVIKPFLNEEWYWENLYNNWTSVCSGAVGCTFMLIRPDLFELVKDRINNNMEKYLSSYKDDGGCVEGPGYWGYGFGFFVEYADMLRDFTDGKEDFFKKDKVCVIGEFFQKLYIDRDVVVNYGDSPSNVCAPRGVMYKLKSIYGDRIELPPQSKMSFESHYYPFALEAMALNTNEFMSDGESQNSEYYMDNVGWYNKKNKKYGIGAKGGSNSESHNHNDVGSFIFAKNNEQVIVDLGTRPYTRQYFEPDKRYTYIETSSAGHNAPIIDDCYQVNNGDTTAKTLFENGVFSVRFENAYQIDGLNMLKRDFKTDDEGVTITDTFEASRDMKYVFRMVTYVEPKILDGSVILDDVSIIFDNSSVKASFKADEHTLELNVDGTVKSSKTIYLIDLELINKSERSLVVKIK